MKTTIWAMATIVGLVASLAFIRVEPWTVPTAEAQQLPGMCNGRSDADVNVKANGTAVEPGGPGGRATVVTYRLDISSDKDGVPSGVLAIGPGPDRLIVTDFCRLWAHLPGEPYGGCQGEQPEGAINIHAVGIGTLSSGEEVLVRTDVRETEEGAFFRIRYRALDGGHEHEFTPAAHEDDGCEDGWERIPVEGWLPLNHLKVR